MFIVENVGNTEKHYYSVIITVNILIYFLLFLQLWVLVFFFYTIVTVWNTWNGMY